MSISTRTVERWTCDRCGVKKEFPDHEHKVAREVGWLQFDLTRSLQPTWTCFDKNEQILCPSCVAELRDWFQEKVG